MPENLVFRLKIWGARDNGIPPRSTPGTVKGISNIHSIILKLSNLCLCFCYLVVEVSFCDLWWTLNPSQDTGHSVSVSVWAIWLSVGVKWYGQDVQWRWTAVAIPKVHIKNIILKMQSFHVEGPRNREISLFLWNKIGRFFTGTFQATFIPHGVRSC